MTDLEGASRLRDLDELKMSYRLQSDSRDVLVEGRSDARLIKWLLLELGLQNIGVFAVDDRVTIPRSTVTEFYSEVNARGRIIAAASIFESWNLPAPNLTCIVDADYDCLLPSRNYPTSLLTTDFSSMEIYSLQRRPFSKFLSSLALPDHIDYSIVDELAPVWKTLFLVRFLFHTHLQGNRLIDDFPAKFFDRRGRPIPREPSEFLKYCHPAPSRFEFATLTEKYDEFVSLLPRPLLEGIRGHDVAPLLIQRLRLKNALANVDIVERLMRTSLEVVDLANQPLFVKLLDRVRN